MKTILCYGDSNTYGLKSDLVSRYPRNVRWTGILQEKLGSEYYVIEEGLGGRTTVWDDPVEDYKNGKKYLLPCLDSHKPLDLVIIMLGTNDLKSRFSVTPFDIGASMENLVKSTVLDDICRRECMYALRDEYAVTLSQEESDQIDIKLSNYYTETNGELLSKIGISKSRLKKVFEKKEIADKVENLMSFNDKKLPDEMYKKWKSDNTVTAEVQWENISFKHHIFTSDDLY